MHIIILTEGGANIGFGHITRCLSLYQAFERKGHCPKFIVNGDETVQTILAQTQFRVCNWLRVEDELVPAVKNADIVIVDSYLAGDEIYRVISGHAGKAAFLDDTRRIDYPAGVVINWNIDAGSLGYPTKPGVQYLLGAEYISLRQGFKERKLKEIKREVTNIMITFGGDDSQNFTPQILNLLVKQYPAVKKDVIIGKAFKNTAAIEAEADALTQLVFSPDDEGMKAVMTASDIAISSGGQTLYELACMGVPAVVVGVAENQFKNIMAWEKANFIENAGCWKDDDLMDRLAAKVAHLQNFTARQTASQNGQRIVTGNGADKIVEFLTNHIVAAAKQGGLE